jgi:WD repeat and SOF domain-containing protein 1
MRPREQRAMRYAETLRQKYAALPQISRIARHRQVPKHIFA